MREYTDKMIAEEQDGIGWITFNNPARRNAVSLEMWEALGAIAADFEKDPTVRVLVMKGAGDKAFVSGADISEFETKRDSAAAEAEYAAKSAAGLAALYAVEKPLIAMIRGFCLGGGLAIALAADIRFATEGSRFAIPAARLGLGYAAAGIKTLCDLVGPSRTLDILFSARLLEAREALDMGLVNRLTTDDALHLAVRDYALGVARNAPLTVKTAKAAVHELLRDPAKRDLGRVEKMVAQCFDSSDYAEGRRAFMEKRKPVFTGK